MPQSWDMGQMFFTSPPKEGMLRIFSTAASMLTTRPPKPLAYDVAYTNFRQDHFGFPEDGAPEAPKHVGTSWYFNL
jgi:hypothetical protein